MCWLIFKTEQNTKRFLFCVLFVCFFFFFLFLFFCARLVCVFFFFACVCCLLPQWIHRRTHSHVSFLIFRGCFFYFFFFHLFWFVSFPWLPLCSLYDFARPARRVVYKTVIDLDELYTQTHAHDRWWASRNHLVRWGGRKTCSLFLLAARPKLRREISSSRGAAGERFIVFFYLSTIFVYQ